MQKQQSGFTLIELMIVVAIIGILASVSIPMYRDYIVRTKVATVLATVNNLKTALTITNNEGTVWGALAHDDAANWATIGMRQMTTTGIEVIDEIDVTAAGLITIVMNTDVAGAGVTAPTITLTPTFGASSTTWTSEFTSGASTTEDLATQSLIQAYLAANANGS